MSQATTANWVKVAAASDLAAGTVISAQVGDLPLAVYRLEDGSVHATHNICTHEYACLSDGWLEDGIIECPLHAGRFDVRTGKGLGAPVDRDVQTFPARIDGDAVVVDIGGQG